MRKIVHFIYDRDEHAIMPGLAKPGTDFDNIRAVFEQIQKDEQSVSESINEIVDLCLKEKDHSTNNFIRWYVSEQIKEESLACSIIDKLDLIDTDST